MTYSCASLPTAAPARSEPDGWQRAPYSPRRTPTIRTPVLRRAPAAAETTGSTSDAAQSQHSHTGPPHRHSSHSHSTATPGRHRHSSHRHCAVTLQNQRSTCFHNTCQPQSYGGNTCHIAATQSQQSYGKGRPARHIRSDKFPRLAGITSDRKTSSTDVSGQNSEHR